MERKKERKYVAYASMYAYNCAGMCMCVLEVKKIGREK